MTLYFVKLDLIIGEFEKSAEHLVEANNETEASKRAIEAECHGEPEWEDEEYEECWDCGQMVYRMYSVKRVLQEDVKILKKYMFVNPKD
jgi:hypothetical protein